MRRSREAGLYAVLPALFLVSFVGVPLLVVLRYAFLGDPHRPPTDGASDAIRSSIQTIFGEAFYRNRILFTLELAVLSTVLTVAAGLPLAYLFSHHEFRGRRLLRALFTAPFVLPAVVVALALYAAMGPHGLLGVDVLSSLGDLGALLLAHVFYNVSLVLRLVGNYWERLPLAYPEAARTLGASRWTTFRRVELPLLRPALLAVGLLVFVFSLTSFALIKFLASDRTGTIETLISQKRVGAFADYGLVAALSLLQIVITYPALLLFILLQRRLRTPSVPRTATSRTPMPAWGYPALALASLFILGPLLALALASLGAPHAWSARPYREILFGEAELGAYTAGLAIRNSLVLALLSLTVALFLGWLAAVAAQRARRAQWGEALLVLPLGLSSIVVALGLFLSWNGRVLPDLRGTMTGIIVAHAILAFPLTTRILSPSLESIEPRLREAARTLGARPFQVVRLIDLPLTYPALGVAAVYAFGASLGEFGATFSLRTTESTTIPIAIFESFGRAFGPYTQYALVLSVLLLAFSILAFLVLERLRIRAWGEFA